MFGDSFVLLDHGASIISHMEPSLSPLIELATILAGNEAADEVATAIRDGRAYASKFHSRLLEMEADENVVPSPWLAVLYAVRVHGKVRAVDWRAEPDELRGALRELGVSEETLDNIWPEDDEKEIEALLSLLGRKLRKNGPLLCSIDTNSDSYELLLVNESVVSRLIELGREEVTQIRGGGIKVWGVPGSKGKQSKNGPTDEGPAGDILKRIARDKRTATIEYEWLVKIERELRYTAKVRRRPLTADEVNEVLLGQIKEARAAMRVDCIRRYLPPILSEDETRQKLMELIEEFGIEDGNTGIGILMKAMRERHGVAVNMQLASKVATVLLTSLKTVPNELNGRHG